MTDFVQLQKHTDSYKALLKLTYFIFHFPQNVLYSYFNVYTNQKIQILFNLLPKNTKTTKNYKY